MAEWLGFLTPLDEVIGALLLLVLGYQLWFYGRYLAGVNRQHRKDKKAVATSLEQPKKGVSVVVCARNEARNLETFLPLLLQQDYPEYEVIVVDDESEDDTRDVVERLMLRYKHLHLTFVPLGTRVSSTKKLALTLAAKASKYDYLLLTDADCYPQSEHWIEQMMRGFEGGKEVVLGFGAYEQRKSLLNKMIAYDTLFNGLQYLGLALAHRPYMGVGRNLAYSKTMFFRQKGFAGLLDRKAGDDDLFVAKVANSHNTQVVVTPESLTWSLPKTSFKQWWQQKRRHLSVSPYYKPINKFRLTMEPLTRGLFYALLIVAGVAGGPVLWIGAAAAFLIRWTVQLSILNRSARAWGMRPFGVSALLFDLFLPLNNLVLLLYNASHRQQNYW